MEKEGGMINRVSYISKFPQLIDSVFEHAALGGTTINFVKKINQYPKVNLSEYLGVYVLELAVPGIVENQLKVVFFKNKFVVSSINGKSHSGQVLKYKQREFVTGEFSRTFEFSPGLIDLSAVKVVYRDGILRLSLPKLHFRRMND